MHFASVLLLCGTYRHHFGPAPWNFLCPCPTAILVPLSLGHRTHSSTYHGTCLWRALLTSSFPSPFLCHLLKAAQTALFCNPFFPMSWISNYIICSSDLRYPCLSPVSPFVSFTWQMWLLWLSAAAVATPGKSCTASEETCSQKVVWLLFNTFKIKCEFEVSGASRNLECWWCWRSEFINIVAYFLAFPSQGLLS